MTRKPDIQAVPPIVRKQNGKAINLYLKPDEIERLDDISGKMKGTRSDAVRWLLKLAKDAMEGKAE